MKPLTVAGTALFAAGVVFASTIVLGFDVGALFSPLVWFYVALFALAALSFGLSRRNPRRGYAIAVVLVLIGGGLVAASVVLYKLPGQIGCLGCGQPPLEGTFLGCSASGND